MNQFMHDISWVVPLRNDFLTPVFQFFTWLGYPTFMMLLLALGYWLWDKKKITKVAIIVVISTVINAFLKDLWENPRPDLLFRLDNEVGKSFGMPSGHAQVSATLWFWVAYEVRRIWAWIAASIIVIGICFSRIYLGIHDVEDILAGLLIALFILVAYRFALSATYRLLTPTPIWLILCIIVVAGVITRVVWPPAENSIGAIVVFGVLFGWVFGRNLEPGLVGFKPRSSPWNIALIALLGVAGLMGLLAAAALMLKGFEPLIEGTIRSTLIGFYMTLVAPLLFRLCRLHVSEPLAER